MQRILFATGTLSGALAVMLGAFGAHALKAKLDAAQLQTFETGVRYQFYHTFAILLVAMLMDRNQSSLLNYSGYSFITGIVLFSGSLYLLATKSVLGIESWGWLGPVTPLGGLAFISGWLMLLLATLKKGVL